KNSTVMRFCNADTKHCTDQKGVDAAQSAQQILPINTATWIVGIAGVGVGAVLILTSLGGDTKAPPKEPPVTPAAAVLPGGGSLGLSGRFWRSAFLRRGAIIPADPGHHLPETRGVDAVGPPRRDIDAVKQVLGRDAHREPCPLVAVAGADVNDVVRGDQA